MNDEQLYLTMRKRMKMTMMTKWMMMKMTKRKNLWKTLTLTNVAANSG